MSPLTSPDSISSHCVLSFLSSRRRHTRCYRDWSSDVCSSDLTKVTVFKPPAHVTAGTTWNALVNVSRRGRRLDGFRTAIEIQDADGRVTFPGHEIEPGDRKSVV